MFVINPMLYGSVFVVPSAIVEKYIKLASPLSLKALLCILSNPAEYDSVEKIAAKIGYSKVDTQDAVLFWVNENVLTEHGKAFSDGKKSDEPEKVTASVKKENVIPAPQCKEPLPEIKISKPTMEQLTKRMNESQEVSILMKEAQQILGRTFGFDVQSTLLMLYDTYGLNLEVIFTLLEFCVQQSCSATAYIAKLGKIWAERDINTLDAANEYIEKSTNAEKLFAELKELTGISTPRPTPKQTDYLSDWSGMGYGAEMISRAYDEASERTGKISFAYMDKVLKNWHNSGYKNTDDVEKGLKEFRDKKNAVTKGDGTSFDIDEAVNEAVYGTVKYKKKERREN